MNGPEQSGAPPELARCLSEPGYTPPLRALDPLLKALIALPEESALLLERALARAGEPTLNAGIQLLAERDPSERTRLFGLFVRLAGEVAAPALYDTLLAGLAEPLAQNRKLAARGLGKLGDARAEERLLEALERSTGTERKSIVEALGSVGGPSSARRLAVLETDDADLQRRRERAGAQIERRLRRAADAGELQLDVPLGAAWKVALTCRRGLAPVLADEVRALGPEPRRPERVDVRHAGSLRELLTARTWLEAALVVPLKRPSGRQPAEHIADALAAPEVVSALARWTRGVPRFRVSWTSGGHHRGLTWALASALRSRTTALVNDSHDARWTLRASPSGEGELLLAPRLAPDPRFAYRVADVPAASHPTIAAALARLAGVQPDEVVWDPFVGSGLELIERARLEPVRELWGTDLDERALGAARQNFGAAGVSGVRLERADALTFATVSPSLIISNPPMGRRVARDGSVGELLEAFARRAATLLRPAGRLVWLSPFERRTERAAQAAGLHVETGPEVDLGGFSARVQVCRRAS